MSRPIIDDKTGQKVCKKDIDSRIDLNPVPCVGTSTDPDFMYCIPKDAGDCPITKVTFKEDPAT
jgi:hypothetical protein